MQRGVGITLRALGIVFIICALVLAGLFVMLIFAFGGSRERQQGQVFVAGLTLAVAAGVAGIFYLSRGIVRDIRHSQAAAAAEPEGAIPDTPEMRQALEYMRYAIILVMLLDAGAWFRNAATYHQSPRATVAAVIAWTLYQIPYGIILWRIWNGYDRPAVAFALVLPCVSALWTIGFDAYYWHVYTNRPEALLISLLLTAAEIGIAVTAWLARRLVANVSDENWLLIAGGSAVVYLLLLRAATTLLFRLAY